MDNYHVSDNRYARKFGLLLGVSHCTKMNAHQAYTDHINTGKHLNNRHTHKNQVMPHDKHVREIKMCVFVPVPFENDAATSYGNDNNNF